MDTYVVGFKPPDEKWQKMFAIWKACDEANISTPEEVNEFFNDEEPDESGVRVDLSELEDCCREWNDGDMSQGFEIVVDKIPKDIKVVRFYNSW